MSKEGITYPLRGLMIFPTARSCDYRGVDRAPFEPTFVEDEMSGKEPATEPYIWTFYPPGWRRDAYRLYEENTVPNTGAGLDMLCSLDIAHEIVRIIEPHIGPHEIIACEIWCLEFPPPPNANRKNLIGYDVAYLGGDFFSAIRAGIFGHPLFRGEPFPRLVLQFKSQLNKYGLFSSADPVGDYVVRFKEEVPSEEASDFHIWRLDDAGLGV
jgi:hypothetical protein